MRTALAGVLLFAMQSRPQMAAASTLCPIRITTLSEQVGLLTVTTSAQRVELRKCDDGPVSLIQLAAWSRGAKRPEIIVDTNQPLVERIIMQPWIVIIETSGETSNTLYVIVFEKGMPRVALARPTKADISVAAAKDQITITIPRSRQSPEVLNFRPEQ